MNKLAVLFPGIGYTCHKPLLYYGAKTAEAAGYSIIRLSYSGFPSGVKGNKEKMRLCFNMALEQTREALSEVTWTDYDDIVFISKSVGTAVASAYAKENGINARHVLLTPVEDTFAYADKHSIVFHGSADPWADTPVITSLCVEHDIPIYLTPDANHSLETGDVEADIKELGQIMDIIKGYLDSEAY